MYFKNLTKYVFTCCEFNVVWQLVPQPESWCSEGSLSVHCCMAFWYPLLRIGLRSEHSHLYIYFRSYRLDTLVLFHSVLWMYETWSNRVIWNIQEASAAGTKVVLYVPFFKCVSPEVMHSSAQLSTAQDVSGDEEHCLNRLSLVSQVSIWRIAESGCWKNSTNPPMRLVISDVYLSKK